MNKIAVFTSITGDYDEPVIDQNYEGADFFLFTDKNIDEFKKDRGKWKLLSATNMFSDPRRNARYHKLIPHEIFSGYDYTIWIDGSIKLISPPIHFIKQMNEHDILTCYHPVRNCIYKEAEECLRLKLDSPEKINFHVDRLKAYDYPEENGLAETKIVVRKNTPIVNLFNQEWFYQLMTGSARDQLSFNYAAWITGVRVRYIDPISKGNKNLEVSKKHERRQY